MNIDLDTLINGCKANDIKCQQELYKLCYPEMIKICFRYADDADGAGTIFNNAMLKVFKYINNYKEDGKLMSWVKTIVVNCSLDFCKKNNSYNKSQINFSGEEIILNPDAFNNISAKEISQFIKQLPSASATVFNMYVYEGFTHKQIGEILGISDGTSKWHLSEAKKSLKSKLEKFSKNELKVNAAG